MRFTTAARGVLVGVLALGAAAAGPLRGAGGQAHAVLDAGTPDSAAVPRWRSLPARQQHQRREKQNAGAAAHTIPDSHTVHERQPDAWAQRWQRTARAPADAVLPMRVGLQQQQRSLDEGHARLMAMADPASPRYGRHMSAAAVVDLFAPARASVDAVVAWLTAAGIAVERLTQSANRQWIQFDATVAEAEQLLLTEFHVFEHGATGTRDVAAPLYHVPRHVQPHIDYVTPGIRLRRDADKARKMRRRRRAVKAMHTDPVYLAGGGAAKGPHSLPEAAAGNNCTLYVTPACIRTQYGIPNGTTAVAGNQLGIFESLGQHYSEQDLDMYFASVAPEIPPGTYPESRLIDGARATAPVGSAGSEADLDFEAAMPLIYPQQAVLFQADDERIQANMTMGRSPYLGFWNTFFDAIDGSYCSYSAFGETGNCVRPECLDPAYPDTAGGAGSYNGSLQCGVYKPTNVISISYGGGEADLPAYYWKRQCSEILKLGLQGVTVVISSGDDGVASAPYAAGHYDGCAGDDGQIFFPASEATCPYVLAVGSTELRPAPAAAAANGSANATAAAPPPPRLTERATSRFGSGGGFSNYFAQPAYQAAAVARYFDTVPLDFAGYAGMGDANFSGAGAGVYHRGGRGYPDVAAVGDHFVTVINGGWALIGGTSLSAPVWAAVLTRINEARLAQGKATVGFVNPALYAHPEVFHDVTAGSNPGCGTGGFPAAAGWDPVTGLGTPDFAKLLALFTGLP